MAQKIKVFIIDDSLFYIKNILAILRNTDNINVVGYAQSVKEAQNKLSSIEHYPDII